MANSSAPCRSTLRRSVPTEAGLDLIEVVASADLADLRKFPFEQDKRADAHSLDRLLGDRLLGDWLSARMKT